MPRRKYPWLPYKYERLIRDAERRFEAGMIDACDVRAVENYVSKKLAEEAKKQPTLPYEQA